MNDSHTITMTDTRNRTRGCLMGLAVGDAVGTTVEFMPRGSFEPLTNMVGGGPFNLAPGQWTDDTSMALCLAESLIVCGEFDLEDQIQRYVLWADQGHLSSTGKCFDIGIATSEALLRYKTSGTARAGSTDPLSAGNGSIMRLAPVAIRYLHDPEMALHYSQEQSKTTHRAMECLHACRLLCEILLRSLRGESKEQVLSPVHHTENFSDRLELIAQGGYLNKSKDEIESTGYVVSSLEAALWSFSQTNCFRDCILMAANLGDDADTTAAISGQIAGAFYGFDGIPSDWVKKIAMREIILEMADVLVEI